jgi:hypothetical protein
MCVQHLIIKLGVSSCMATSSPTGGAAGIGEGEGIATASAGA